jgi:2Fe-2S iron-sulfur cluster binding domain
VPITIKVNGIERAVDVDGDTPLLWVLRDVLGMTGTKFGCGMALCGACTVHIDGVATRSYTTPIDGIGNAEITTIEAIGTTPAGAKIQKAWLDCEVPQCGYWVRSCQLRRSWRATLIQRMPISTRRWPATSAAAALIFAFVKQLSRLRNRTERQADMILAIRSVRHANTLRRQTRSRTSS